MISVLKDNPTIDIDAPFKSLNSYLREYQARGYRPKDSTEEESAGQERYAKKTKEYSPQDLKDEARKILAELDKRANSSMDLDEFNKFHNKIDISKFKIDKFDTSFMNVVATYLYEPNNHFVLVPKSGSYSPLLGDVIDYYLFYKDQGKIIVDELASNMRTSEVRKSFSMTVASNKFKDVPTNLSRWLESTSWFNRLSELPVLRNHKSNLMKIDKEEDIFKKIRNMKIKSPQKPSFIITPSQREKPYLQILFDMPSNNNKRSKFVIEGVELKLENNKLHFVHKIPGEEKLIELASLEKFIKDYQNAKDNAIHARKDFQEWVSASLPKSLKNSKIKELITVSQNEIENIYKNINRTSGRDQHKIFYVNQLEMRKQLSDLGMKARQAVIELEQKPKKGFTISSPHKTEIKQYKALYEMSNKILNKHFDISLPPLKAEEKSEAKKAFNV